MKDFKLLYEIKNLNHLVARLLIKDCRILRDRHIPTPTQMQIVDYILKNEVCRRSTTPLYPLQGNWHIPRIHLN